MMRAVRREKSMNTVEPIDCTDEDSSTSYIEKLGKKDRRYFQIYNVLA